MLLKLSCVYGWRRQGILLKTQILVQQVCSGCQMVRPLLLAHKPHVENLGAGISNAYSIALEAWRYLDFFLHKVIHYKIQSQTHLTDILIGISLNLHNNIKSSNPQNGHIYTSIYLGLLCFFSFIFYSFWHAKLGHNLLELDLHLNSDFI